jgi:hypothetical protein
MKSALMTAALLLVAMTANADEKFDKLKQETLSHLDARIQDLNEAKSCVSSAQNLEALKKCRMDMRGEHMKMRGQMMEKRKARLDEQIKKLEAEKQKLDKPEAK